MQKLIWGFLFLIIVLLTMSHVVIDFSSMPSWLGLPVWLYWYMFLHAALIGLLLLFIRKTKEE